MLAMASQPKHRHVFLCPALFFYTEIGTAMDMLVIKHSTDLRYLIVLNILGRASLHLDRSEKYANQRLDDTLYQVVILVSRSHQSQELLCGERKVSVEESGVE